MDETKDYFSYKIVNGRIYTDYVEQVAVIDGNNLVSDVSFQQILGELKGAKHNIVLTKGTPRIKKKIKGRVLSLVQGASGNNYYHWMFDILPKMKLCSEHYPLKEINYFYASSLQDFQRQTLPMLDIDEKKFLSSESNRHIQANEIIVADHPWYHEGYIRNQAELLPSWVVEWVRKTYLKHAKKFDCNEKVYIDRSESKYTHCQIQNDEEVSSFLLKKGFSKYKVGKLSFTEQIYLFNNAKIVIGAHGAALTNLVFCKPDTDIIEIKPLEHPSISNYTNNNYKRISEINNLNYNLIESKGLNENQKKFGDIYLSLDDLEKYIKN